MSERIFINKLIDGPTRVCGYIKAARIQKTINFYNLVDITGEIQILDKKKIYKIKEGDFCDVFGQVITNNNKKEIIIQNIEIFSSEVASDISTFAEETKLQFRSQYIKQKMLPKLKLFSNLISDASSFLENKNFINIKTPILSFKNLSGAGSFSARGIKNIYHLPQSPQHYKQFLMTAGVDRYYQIATCFRDEDQRQDRQFEFTQLDLEMAFVNRDNILELVFELIEKVLKKYIIEEYSINTITFNDAIKFYGTDSPFIYKDIKLIQINDGFYFDLYKEIFELIDFSLLKSKFFEINLEIKDNLIYIYDSIEKAGEVLKYCLKHSKFTSIVIVKDFPLFELKDGELISVHNPFSKPIFLDENDPLKSISTQIDVVINGFEVGGGAERIAEEELQNKIFKILKLPINTSKLFKKQSIPPHGGIAFGLERTLQAIYKDISVREFIAFPKTQLGKCLIFETYNE